MIKEEFIQDKILQQQADMKAFITVFRFLNQKVGEVAEDIVQDVFIRLWEKKAEYDKIPDFRTFLYVAVRNLCYNYLRDKKKTIDFSQIELPDKQLSFQEQLT